MLLLFFASNSIRPISSVPALASNAFVLSILNFGLSPCKCNKVSGSVSPIPTLPLASSIVTVTVLLDAALRKN